MERWWRLAELDARAARLLRRLEALGESGLPARYALAKEIDDLEFLIDPGLLWGPPRVTVRRGHRTVEVWLDPDAPRVSRPGSFTASERRRLLALVGAHAEELTSAWFDLREDRRRGRLQRNVFVD